MKEKIREQIFIGDVHNQTYPEDWDGFKLIESKEQNFDQEKGFIDYECVIQRLLDDKFFGFTYTKFGNNGSDLLEQTAEEVFKKTKIIEYYE